MELVKVIVSVVAIAMYGLKSAYVHYSLDDLAAREGTMMLLICHVPRCVNFLNLRRIHQSATTGALERDVHLLHRLHLLHLAAVHDQPAEVQRQDVHAGAHPQKLDGSTCWVLLHLRGLVHSVLQFCLHR